MWIAGIAAVVCFAVAFIAMILSIVDIDSDSPDNNDCVEICNSNDSGFLKFTSSGYAGLTHICYCEDSEGRISTYLM